MVLFASSIAAISCYFSIPLTLVPGVSCGAPAAKCRTWGSGTKVRTMTQPVTEGVRVWGDRFTYLAFHILSMKPERNIFSDLDVIW